MNWIAKETRFSPRASIISRLIFKPFSTIRNQGSRIIRIWYLRYFRVAQVRKARTWYIRRIFARRIAQVWTSSLKKIRSSRLIPLLAFAALFSVFSPYVLHSAQNLLIPLTILPTYEEQSAFSPNTKSQMAVGDRAFAEDNYNKAFSAYLIAFKKTSSPAERIFLLSKMSLAQFYLEKWETFSKIQVALLKKNANDLSAHYNLALGYYYQGELAKSKGTFQALIKKAPAHVHAYNALAVIHQQSGQSEHALVLYHRSLQLNPNAATIYERVGDIYRLASDPARAIFAYQRALALDDPTVNSSVRESLTGMSYNLAIFHDSQNQLKEALAYISLAIKTSPNFASAYNMLGILQLKTKKFRKAVSSFEKAIALDPELPHPYYELGLVYENAKRDKRAASYFEKVTQLDSNFLQAWQKLAEIYHETGNVAASHAARKHIASIAPLGGLAHQDQENLEPLPGQ